MRMTDYIKLSRAIKDCTISGQEWAMYTLISSYCVPQSEENQSGNRTIEFDKFLLALCDILVADNPKFDKSKFMEACK